MNPSLKYKRLSRVFSIFSMVSLLLLLASVVIFILNFAKNIPSKVVTALICILIFVVWFFIFGFLLKLSRRFLVKSLVEKTSELGLREILSGAMDVTLFDPQKALPEQTLTDYNVLYPGTISGKPYVSGNYLIRGTYHDKSVEMSSVQLTYTRNTAGRPTETWFNGTIVILNTRDSSGLQYYFRQNDKYNYKLYILNQAGLKKSMPFDIGHDLECYTLDHAAAARFTEEHKDWLSGVTGRLPVRFIIHSYSYVILGIEEQLYAENRDEQTMRNHFERTLKNILEYCVDPFE